MTTTITRTTIRVTVPIVLVLSIWLFLQGHNLPGGGFIGGVLTTTAFVLIYVAYDLDYLESDVLDRDVDPGTSIFEHRTVTAYRRMLLAGLAVVVGSGVAGILVGDPFLTQTYVHFEHVPIYHEVELASALVFDLGVFLVVVGSLLTIISVVSGE
ncbi:multicomponent Na+:H+ antiporter subunit B [Halopelagius inordinatus]|uniref:Multicomponent Na+:H+ antiporter subunit B n=1 Tax=Halopelagius inordinatus TaxID=553467 RepID=A0A1I2SRS1_9EURY|nr:MnhB domain-containing protein [Halopelagius inordinatus]SFG55430.1 multicomponent Na+:H+ antiporter subunit B [Halopelagius inordinatus]